MSHQAKNRSKAYNSQNLEIQSEATMQPNHNETMTIINLSLDQEQMKKEFESAQQKAESNVVVSVRECQTSPIAIHNDQFQTLQPKLAEQELGYTDPSRFAWNDCTSIKRQFPANLYDKPNLSAITPPPNYYLETIKNDKKEINKKKLEAVQRVKHASTIERLTTVQDKGKLRI